MNIYRYLPSLFSIYLIFISSVSSKYLKNQVHRFVVQKPGLENNERFIQNVALDWASRLGFINSMIVSLVSVASLQTNSSTSSIVALLVLFALIAVFSLMLFWVLSHDPGDLVAMRMRRINITPATVCRIVLIFVNILMLIAIYVTAVTSNTSPSTP